MKNKGIILFFLLALLVIAAVIFLLDVFIPAPVKEEPKGIPLDEVEFTRNHLRNYSFEKEFSDSDWFLEAGNNSYSSSFDNIVKKSGSYSLQLLNDKFNNGIIKVSQKLPKVEPENKYIFFAMLKTEESDSVRLEINGFNEKDSLLNTGYSASVKGTTDWQLIGAWLRTQRTDIKKIVASVVVMGRGRLWIDDCELFVVPIEYPYSQIDFERLVKKNLRESK
ncbi:MAG: hypothetical protein AB9882_09950 [Ignavibacteriaceae bacterium]